MSAGKRSEKGAGKEEETARGELGLLADLGTTLGHANKNINYHKKLLARGSERVCPNSTLPEAMPTFIIFKASSLVTVTTVRSEMAYRKRVPSRAARNSAAAVAGAASARATRSRFEVCFWLRSACCELLNRLI